MRTKTRMGEDRGSRRGMGRKENRIETGSWGWGPDSCGNRNGEWLLGRSRDAEGCRDPEYGDGMGECEWVLE